MRLSRLFLAAVFLISSSLLGQHSSSGGSSGSSSSGSSGGGSHSSSSGGSSYSGGSSGGGSHSSGGSFGGSSHSAGASQGWAGGHSSGSSHGSGSGHVSGGTVSNRSAAHGSSSNLLNSSHIGKESSSSKIAPIREPKSAASERAAVAQKRSFFTFLRHPFRKPQPKVVQAKAGLYLPRPICPKGRCTPGCPTGQVSKGGACTSPVIPLCGRGQWNAACSNRCPIGQVWNGGSCGYSARFLDNCIGLRMALNRQAQRVQAAESIRQSACSNGPAQECSSATSTWQSEESLREKLLRGYEQCRLHSIPEYSAQYGLRQFDPMLWFNSLEFNAVF